MSSRMGVIKNKEEIDNYIDCGLRYDYELINNLKFIGTECIKCNKKDCYGCSYFDKGYYILDKNTLLKFKNVVNYEYLMDTINETDNKEIYLIIE